VEPVLQVQDVHKAFRDTRAVDGVSFDVGPGEVFGLLGPNGAGKSTLIRIVLDIYRPDAGAVSIFGHPMRREDLDRIGYLPEERGLYRKRRVVQVLGYLGRLKGLTAGDAVASADRLLARLSMQEFRDKKVETLSKGNQQKIQLIGTLLGAPRVLVWDEPFSGLDPVNANQVRDLLIELRDGGMTIILSTHLMAQAEALCDRVGLISRGRMVLCGSTPDVREHYGGNQAVIVTDAPIDSSWDEVAQILETTDLPEARRFLVCLETGAPPEALARSVLQRGHHLLELRRHRPSLEEVFLRAVRE
jgi:ABC-2 type transport system ATP-binding protein